MIEIGRMLQCLSLAECDSVVSKHHSTITLSMEIPLKRRLVVNGEHSGFWPAWPMKLPD